MNHAQHHAELAAREARARQSKIDEVQRELGRLEFRAREQAAAPPKMTPERRRALLGMLGIHDAEPGTA
jgi:hypothetical protein